MDTGLRDYLLSFDPVHVDAFYDALDGWIAELRTMQPIPPSLPAVWHDANGQPVSIPAIDRTLSEAIDELLKAGGSPPWPGWENVISDEPLTAEETEYLHKLAEQYPPEDADGCETEFVEDDDGHVFEYECEDDEEGEDDGPVSIPAWAERPHWLEGYLSSIGQDDLEQEDDE